MRKMPHRPRYSNNELEGAITLPSSVTEGRGVLFRDEVLLSVFVCSIEDSGPVNVISF